jgi:hypothetical protein
VFQVRNGIRQLCALQVGVGVRHLNAFLVLGGRELCALLVGG